MYAIVDIAGQQFKVEKNQEVLVHRLPEDEGAAVIFDTVLLLDESGKISVGQPKVAGAAVAATIIEHLKGDKVMVFHKNRRKGYRKLNGHRQALSKIIIQGISTDIEALKKEVANLPKPEKKVKVEAPAKKAKTVKKEAVKVEKKAPAKKVVAKKTAEKKAPAKKVAAKKTTTKTKKSE